MKMRWMCSTSFNEHPTSISHAVGEPETYKLTSISQNLTCVYSISHALLPLPILPTLLAHLDLRLPWHRPLPRTTDLAIYIWEPKPLPSLAFAISQLAVCPIWRLDPTLDAKPRVPLVAFRVPWPLTSCVGKFSRCAKAYAYNASKNIIFPGGLRLLEIQKSFNRILRRKECVKVVASGSEMLSC
jgi:hypothetical protein